jgi:hypothetical protein
MDLTSSRPRPDEHPVTSHILGTEDTALSSSIDACTNVMFAVAVQAARVYHNTAKSNDRAGT